MYKPDIIVQVRKKFKFIPKKVNLIEIGSLEVYERGGGVSQGLHCIASLHVPIYAYFLATQYIKY